MTAGSAVVGGFSVAPAVQAADPDPAQPARDHQPSWFTAEEFAFIKATVARLIPNDERGLGTL